MRDLPRRRPPRRAPGPAAPPWPLLLAALCASSACACEGPEGMWRDQLVFIGDDGRVIPLGVLRWSTGRAEAKGWVGEGGAWRSTFFHRFSVSGPAGPDLERALLLLSASPASPARVSLRRRGRGVALRLRTPSTRARLEAPELVELGRSRDPEGTSVYRAGRAVLVEGGARRRGWLVMEETPRERPRRGFMELGDFVFLAVADPERGAVVAKRSLGVAGFDHAFASLGGSPRGTERVEVSRGEGALELSLPELSIHARLPILDRSRARGTAPGGAPVDYEALLLGGALPGVAFTIRPRTGDPP